MTRRQIATVFIALLLTASAAQAFQPRPASVTGTWTGTMIFMKDGKVVDDDPVHMVLKHEGTTLSGTAGPNPTKQFPIAKAKIVTGKTGPAMTFEVTAGQLVLNFDLKLVQGQIKGTVAGEKDGDKQTATVELKPVK